MAADADARVLIVGGGIAGLTTAIALRHYGIDSLVFEQVDDVRKSQHGSGLTLHINATRAFKHLGLLDELSTVAAPLDGFRFMTSRGKRIGIAHHIEGETTLGILRPLLHEFLVDAVGEERLQLGAKLLRFEQDDDGVTAHFADGRNARGEVLIGADGFDSTVRTQLIGKSEPRYAGYCTRRGVAETEAARDRFHVVFLGRGQRFVFLPVGQRHVYWTAATNEPPGGREDGSDLKRRVLELFEGWPDPVKALVEATDESNTFFADIYDRDPVRRWGEGRATLLGDAAHPMTWDRGQGAGQGIEGGVMLARRLADGGDPADTLRAWEAERIARTSKVVLSSRRSGKLQQTDNPFLHLVVKQALRVLSRDAVWKLPNRADQIDY
ncbi:MAG: FAD-dependent monooxygenase [Actinomycetota bacterium]|nr:FAD-dependent monooxygenase [Actinomycetota bacterium]